MKNQRLKVNKHSSKVKTINKPISTIGFLAALLAFAFCVLPLKSAFAQNSDGRLDLTVSPPVIEIVAKPGEKITEKFRVRNNLNSSIDLKIQTRRLISDPESGNPVPETQPEGEELKWVTFDSSEFTARPLEWQDINFSIDIPENASFGYYYVFSISPKDNSKISATGADIKGEILIVALLTVIKDGANSKTDLVSFKAENNISEYLPANFKIKLANKGNVHVKPRGNIFITRSGGEEIGILEVNESMGSILPGGQREFSAPWADGFLVREPIMENGSEKLDEAGNQITKLKFNWNKLTSFRIGPYTARLLMVYDDGKKDVTIEGSTTFWIIPYTAIVFILISLIILFFIFRFLLRLYVKRAIQKSRK